MSDIQKIIIDTDNAIKTCMEQLFFYHQNVKLILPNKTKVLMLCNQYLNILQQAQKANVYKFLNQDQIQANLLILNDINKAFAKVK